MRTDRGHDATRFPKPDHGFTPHGQFSGRSLEELVKDPEGRAQLAAHVPQQGRGRQKLRSPGSPGLFRKR